MKFNLAKTGTIYTKKARKNALNIHHTPLNIQQMTCTNKRVHQYATGHTPCDTHQQQCVSIWLSTLPLKYEGYYLNKQEFQGFSEVKVWLVIVKATYPMNLRTLRQTHIRKVTAELLSQVTMDLKIESVLQSLINETLMTNEQQIQVTMLGQILAQEGFGPNTKKYTLT